MLLLLSLVVLAALGFTLGAFWWMYLRPARLSAVAPSTYAIPAGAVLHLRLPFVFVNDGALPEVVTDLRLRVADDNEFHWTSVRSKVAPSMDDFLDAARPFVVDGRDAVRLVVEFGQVPPEWRPEQGKAYPAVLEGADRSGEWRTLVEFTWFAPARLDQVGAGVAHRNRQGGGPLV
jgi:hypothetical protein